MEYQVVTQPAAEPLTYQEVIEHLRLAFIPGAVFEEARVLSLMTAARQMIEKITGLAMAVQTIEARAHSWECGPLELPMAAPLRSVTSLTYTNHEGTTEPVPYRVDDFLRPARLSPERGQSWPWFGAGGEVSVVYVVGFDAPGTEGGTRPCPEPLKQAMLLLIGHFYENREAVTVGVSASELPMGIEFLVRAYRLHVGL